MHKVTIKYSAITELQNSKVPDFCKPHMLFKEAVCHRGKTQMKERHHEHRKSLLARGAQIL